MHIKMYWGCKNITCHPIDRIKNRFFIEPYGVKLWIDSICQTVPMQPKYNVPWNTIKIQLNCLWKSKADKQKLFFVVVVFLKEHTLTFETLISNTPLLCFYWSIITHFNHADMLWKVPIGLQIIPHRLTECDT